MDFPLPTCESPAWWEQGLHSVWAWSGAVPQAQWDPGSAQGMLALRALSLRGEAGS